MLPGALAIRLLGFAAHASFVVAAAAAAASTPGHQTAKQPVRHCGTIGPSKELVDAHQKLSKSKEQHKTRSIDPNEVINIDLYAHVVMSHKDKQSLIDDNMMKKQMDVLNQAFKKSKFQFHLNKISRVNNATWALYNDTSEMRQRLRQGDQKTVNVFYLEKLGPYNYGEATYPDLWGRSGLTGDYVHVRVDSIAGGSSYTRNEGKVLVHELGHWLGLVHTYEYGCDKGDFINDTPAMADFNDYCEEGRDSCPGADYPGEDPIHNYMSSGPDSCVTEFTSDQTQRMRNMWETFRISKNTKEVSWKEDCYAAFLPLKYDCLEDKSSTEETCSEEYDEHSHLPCNPLSPSTRRECLDRFAPYKDKCRSDSCKVDFANNYEKYCAAEQRVGNTPPDNNKQPPKPSQTEADRAWRMVCRQASIQVREQCTKHECQTEMARGSLFKRCAKTPQDDRQCSSVLDKLVPLCETDQCRRGLQALKSRECVARNKDPVAEYNNGTVTEWDISRAMSPMTRSEWETRCNEAARIIIQSCKAEKNCIDSFHSSVLWTNCHKDRPKVKEDCKALFSEGPFTCQSAECTTKVYELGEKACAGREPKQDKHNKNSQYEK
ncbi:hypothetical protein QQS21_011269 [Conoideocrella luteorostrata]|uniref:Peptidase M43 pregnancy-associated plasma-A domain-containing protein n=1 Tax=Conoideocrella luteorostrata TaxID=1105319 RepID=A0AAJ0CG51_9HYPO|nr:hypothetical protein QQS21_011269 [Conoideocrella luteorostrata]